MHWNRVPLGDRYDILELRFVAVLIDGVTGEERARETVQRTLSRPDEEQTAGTDNLAVRPEGPVGRRSVRRP
jgi:hypothetical protein